MGKLFGTDGIRGVVNAGLDADLAYKVGLAAAEVLASGKKAGEKPLVTIGKDTRISGDLLKGSLIAGLCTAGADVLDLGTLPTPGVAWVTVDEKADAGIVISASHNPFEHNGIKIFNGQGFKLSDELEEKIEDIVLFAHNDVPRKTHGEIGKVSYVAEKAVADYIHDKGLKFGMYSCAGTHTCAGYPGSFEHEFEDAKQFADFGVDYLKYDFCFKPRHMSGELLYKRMNLALRNCGRPILFSACNWGEDNVHNWIRESGAHMYRSTPDIQDNWESIQKIALSQIEKR